MTDTPPVPETPATPPAAPAYAPAPAGPKQTQSIVGFILGIASIVFSWTGILGLAAGIAGLIVSNKAKKSEPGAPAWMHTLGLVLSIVGIVLSVLLGIFQLIALIAYFATLGTLGTTYGY
jgi:hypothetical protein